MPEESHNFASTRARLEEIVTQVRKKDTSLEASLDLLEEGVRLANQCTELIDHADWEAGEAEPAAETGNEATGAEEPSLESDDSSSWSGDDATPPAQGD